MDMFLTEHTEQDGATGISPPAKYLSITLFVLCELCERSCGFSIQDEPITYPFSQITL